MLSFNIEQKGILCFLANKYQGDAEAVKKELNCLKFISKKGEEFETTEDAVRDILLVIENVSAEEFERFIEHFYQKEGGKEHG